MEECDNSTMRQFDNGRGKNGKLECWKNETIRQFDNSTMEEGKMEEWKVGMLEK
jgi:hypothetical protein